MNSTVTYEVNDVPTGREGRSESTVDTRKWDTVHLDATVLDSFKYKGVKCLPLRL